MVENNKQLAKILEVKSQLPHLKAIVQYTGTVDPRDREQVRRPYAWFAASLFVSDRCQAR